MSTVLGPSRAAAGIYIHVPFCRRRCPYCDFSFEVRAADRRFARGVVDEFEHRRSELGAVRFDTISFGGGTPSALPPDDIARIVSRLPPASEVSIEANPEDIDEDTAARFRDAGVTRVSIGVQSFDDDVLCYLGRAHDGAAARRAVERVGKHIDRVGVDLIVGVPGERPNRIDDDVATAAALCVGHVSAYLLTVEEGTPLVQLIATGARAPIDDDAQADAYQRVQRVCRAHGYVQYEISSHAWPGHESRHNRLYWAHSPYLGVGPGAHSMRIDEDGGVVRRHTRARFDEWARAPAAAPFDVERLSCVHALREGIAFGLRDLLSGVSIARLEALHKTRAPADVHAALMRAVADGDVEESAGIYRLTTQGARFADRVARALLAAADG